MSQENTETDNSTGTECPTCGDIFKNKYGVNIHHAKAHNESLSIITIQCDVCGGEIERYKNKVERSERTFCGQQCESEWRKNNFGGEEHPLHEQVLIECEWCGKEVERIPFDVEKNDTHFCSNECMGRYMSEVQTGENNPNWGGGSDPYYGPNWREQRQKALERDNNQCQGCGSKEWLEVHHIRKIDWFKENCGSDWFKKANRVSNLVVLCKSCHGRWEGIPIKPQLL